MELSRDLTAASSRADHGARILQVGTGYPRLLQTNQPDPVRNCIVIGSAAICFSSREAAGSTGLEAETGAWTRGMRCPIMDGWISQQHRRRIETPQIWCRRRTQICSVATSTPCRRVGRACGLTKPSLGGAAMGAMGAMAQEPEQAQLNLNSASRARAALAVAGNSIAGASRGRPLVRSDSSVVTHTFR
jgi:hypothetical protein